MATFQIDITHEGNAALEDAMRIVWKACGLEDDPRHSQKRGVTHYAIRPLDADNNKKLRLVFFRAMTSDLADKIALPFHLDAVGAADFARRWLEEAEYGKQPDHDGDNKKGWRVYNERYGRVDGDWGAVIAVSPAWSEYGK